MQCRGEAGPGVIAPGVLVRAHRDSSPLFEPVEASLHDIAAPIALALVSTEVDRSSWAAAPVRDLIGPLGDRGRDAMPAQPSPVRLRGVALVRDQPLRACPGPATGPGNADLLQRGGQHRGVRHLPAGHHERQHPALAITAQMGLRRQTAAGASDGMISRLVPGFLVVRQGPLWGGAGSPRADGRARSWNRSRPPNPARQPAVPSTECARARAPTHPGRPRGLRGREQRADHGPDLVRDDITRHPSRLAHPKLETL